MIYVGDVSKCSVCESECMTCENDVSSCMVCEDESVVYVSDVSECSSGCMTCE